MDERPDALLKSALEKIVYFEARSEQITNDLNASRSEGEHLKRELATAAQREIELRRQVAELEVRANRAHQEREEQGRMNEALRAERAALIEKLIEASRIHDSDRASQEEEDERFDLASFISELRSEVIAQRSAAPASIPAAVARPSSRPTGFSPPPPSVPRAPLPSAPEVRVDAMAPALAVAGRAPISVLAQHAERLRAEGRLQVSPRQMQELSSSSSSRDAFPGRTEETLFGFSVRELSAPDSSARIRAAERLKALAHPAAAPALATALHAESDPRVQVVLLGTFATFAHGEGVAIVTPLLDSGVPEVRIAALKALIALDASRAGPHLAAAMKDPDRAVRRRASLLALNLDSAAALELGIEAIRDSDPEVRGLAALVLGANGGEWARGLLLESLRDPERKVRQAAAQSLSRILGEDISAVVTMDDAQRRREVRRLSTLPSRPVTQGNPQRIAPVLLARAAETGPSPATSLPASVAALPAAAPSGAEALCASVMVEIRTAIRGRTLGEISVPGEVNPAALQEACELLVARGQVVRRGAKFFAA